VSEREDAQFPLRRFARAAVAILSGGVDQGYVPRKRARPLLARMWRVASAAEVEARFAQLAGGRTAWHLVLAIHLARLAAGAQYLTHDRSWELIAPVAARLQRNFRSWDEVASQVFLARIQWSIDHGCVAPDPHRLAVDNDWLRAHEWRDAPFDARIEEPIWLRQIRDP
jgi:hypothetical protein